MSTRKLQTSIAVRPEIWRALRALAEHRALEEGGRPSVSAAIESLVLAEQKRQAAERA